MARATRLKVYRTPIGFHDAYVAASSQKSALKAWGSAHDLFSTGEAELVVEPELTAEPLSKPGEIIRRVRGTTDEHIAALPPEPAPPKLPPRQAAPSRKSKATAPPKPKPKPKPPKPDRTAVDAAKAALRAAADRHAEAIEDIQRRERELRQERLSLEEEGREATGALRTKIDAAEAAYEEAMQAWRRWPKA